MYRILYVSTSVNTPAAGLNKSAISESRPQALWPGFGNPGDVGVLRLLTLAATLDFASNTRA
jgi:hypothetical protein